MEARTPGASHARVGFVAHHTTRTSQSAKKIDRADRNTAEIVSGRWLVKALLATMVAAGIALYSTVCLLFYQGQWQFVFFPPKLASHAAPPTAATIAAKTGLPITDVQFDTTEEGVEQLDGWWIPASTGSASGNAQANFAMSKMVVLFCPDGRTALPENIDALRAFHALGVSVFAFDYRGFGASQPGHPSQQKSYADGIAALHYLTDTHHIDPKRIVIYGAELGAAVAAHVAQQSPYLAGVMLENPQPSFAKRVKREQHIHVLPLWLIFPDRFDISRIVPALKMPKLFIFTGNDADATGLYANAPASKRKVRIDGNTNVSLYAQPTWQEAVRRFLTSVARRSH